MDKSVLKTKEFQWKIKNILGLEYLHTAKLDDYNGNLFILKHIWKNSTKSTSQIHYLGWDDPRHIPFYPNESSYRGATSGSKYNKELIMPGEKMVEYDFKEAYTNIMRNYYLPSNVYLENAKFDLDKIMERMDSYDKPQPYRKLSTFVFVKVYIDAFVKEGVYIDTGSHLNLHGNTLSTTLTITEIELKLIMDFYDVKRLEILETYTFRCRKGILDDYFEKIDHLKEDEETLWFYKMLRNKIYGTIGKRDLNDYEKKIFQFPMYNRAFSSAVAGIFRDRIARYEQKYVNSEYGLILIKTDGLYFKKEVPEFEALAQRGIVKKKIHTITEDDVHR